MRALASYRLTFLASLAGASVNAVFGFIVAWMLVRYRFPGRRIVDALVDLPFALPTAVSGIALTALYAENGWIGRLLAPLGIKSAFSPLGVTIALTFVGLPFVVRTLQPALEDLDRGPRGSRRDARRHALADVLAGHRCPHCSPPCSPASRWRSRARSANTARWSSSRATCR